MLPKLLRITSLLAAGALGASCATTSQSASVDSVDNLVGHVERVHLEMELAKQAVHAAVISMGEIFRKDFEGDPAVAYAAFMERIEGCQAQANGLRDHLSPMRNSADRVFGAWTESLDDISSESMRDRAAARLTAAKERYAKVEETGKECQERLDELNRQLRDVALFLGHDLNPDAVETVREDALAIRDAARVLSAAMDGCMDASAEYVERTALLGQRQVEAEAGAEPR